MPPTLSKAWLTSRVCIYIYIIYIYILYILYIYTHTHLYNDPKLECATRATPKKPQASSFLSESPLSQRWKSTLASQSTFWVGGVFLRQKIPKALWRSERRESPIRSGVMGREEPVEFGIGYFSFVNQKISDWYDTVLITSYHISYIIISYSW